jgi:tRNA(Ser,Leu) C12 N-acetylase TAN1
MWEFNLVVTLDADGEFGRLLHDLEAQGDFHPTSFFGVILGRVPDPEGFLHSVRQARREGVAFSDLGRIVPVDRVFTFTPDDFLDRVCRALGSYLPRLAGRHFYVRLERRGLKGEIVSPEAERSLDDHILEELGRQGSEAEIDFEGAEAVVAVETIGDRCGIGLLTRQQMDRYDFVRVG